MQLIRVLVLAFVLPVFSLPTHAQIAKAVDEAKDLAQALEKAKVAAAMAQIKVLDQIIELYRLDHDNSVPESLDVLLKPDPNNADKPYLATAKSLQDPWSKKYQYDPKGPRNAGKRPDIWAVTGDKKIIGNFSVDK